MCWSDKPCKIAKGISLPKGYVMLRKGAYAKGESGFRYAHRIAYRDAHGLSSEQMAGVSVLHHCDTPACHEPTHLFAGTQLDNMRDKVAKGRQHKGEQIVQSKLRAEEVLLIRAEYKRGSSTHGQYALAKEFGISQSLVSMIVKRDIWTHI